MDTGFLRELSIEDLLSLAAALISELGNRLRVSAPAQHSSGPALTQPLLHPEHCGYTCAFCSAPCSRSEEGHRHHKCRAHRRW